MTLKLAIAQLNFVVGDLAGNAKKIVDAARRAHAQGARLLLTPELSIAGYAAEDLFLRPAFTEACDDAVKGIAAALADLKDMVVVVGHPTGGSLRSRSVAVQMRHNAASVIKEGRILETYAKRELPNYQVFDERRYFTPGQGTCVFEAGGVSVGLLICEDAWFDQPADLARESGAEVLAVINASPYHVGKEGERVARMADRARSVGLPLVYAHLVGGQDEVVFDGASFALQADGDVAMQAESFREKLLFVQLERTAHGGVGFTAEPAAIAPVRDAEAQLWDALVLGVRDYIGKNGLSGRHPGALGRDRLRIGACHRGRCTGQGQGARGDDAFALYRRHQLDRRARHAERMGVRYDEISIKHTFESFKGALAEEFKGRPEDTAEENIQARIRGTLLMGLSNKFGSIVLTTGNKSEMATGYCTLYGDMAGGFAVIKDLLKTTVFALARWRNAHDPYGTGTQPIPERIITRPPSAELRPDQTDQDSLPPTTSSMESWHATCRTTRASTRSLPRATTARWSSVLHG
jgi:NAD+ synthase (glutamine-hydrolysing)